MRIEELIIFDKKYVIEEVKFTPTYIVIEAFGYGVPSSRFYVTMYREAINVTLDGDPISPSELAGFIDNNVTIKEYSKKINDNGQDYVPCQHKIILSLTKGIYLRELFITSGFEGIFLEFTECVVPNGF